MNNEEYLNKIKNTYPSLKTFSLDNNILTFYDEENNVTYKVLLQNISLFSLNQNLFTLKPRDIYRIIYMLQVLQKESSNEQEQKFIKDYVTKYLKLQNERLNNKDVDENLIYNMEFPILLIDDPREDVQNNIKNGDAKKIIKDILNEHVENINKGGEALVLRTKYYKSDNEKTEIFDPSSKSGFTSFILVLITIILTIVYIALFLNK